MARLGFGQNLFFHYICETVFHAFIVGIHEQAVAQPQMFCLRFRLTMWFFWCSFTDSQASHSMLLECHVLRCKWCHHCMTHDIRVMKLEERPCGCVLPEQTMSNLQHGAEQQPRRHMPSTDQPPPLLFLTERLRVWRSEAQWKQPVYRTPLSYSPGLHFSTKAVCVCVCVSFTPHLPPSHASPTFWTLEGYHYCLPSPMKCCVSTLL